MLVRHCRCDCLDNYDNDNDDNDDDDAVADDVDNE